MCIRDRHTHVVGTGALNVTFAILHAAPEVAAADDDAHFNAHLAALLDYVAPVSYTHLDVYKRQP